MNIDSKDIIDAIQKAGKVETVEKLLWDIKGSIKQDIQAFANQTKNDILHANQMQVEQFKNVVNEAISLNNERRIVPLEKDIIEFKSDKKGLKWVIIAITGLVSTGWTIMKEYFLK